MPDLFRYDRGELARSVKTREGFLLVEGYVAKPGILEYIKADGTIQRELVTDEVLHDPASLATLGRKPATLEHPPGNITPDNVVEHGVGDVDGEIEVVTQGGYVKVRLAVRRRDALDAIERGDALELSPGYAITLDDTPGVHPVYGEYDAVQTSRKYNHIALTAAARGGPSIRIRADSAVDTRLQGDSMDPTIIAALAAALTTAGVRFDSNEIAKADAGGIASHIGQLADAFGAARDALAAATAKHDQEGVEGDEEDPDADPAAKEDADEDAETEDKNDTRLAWHNERKRIEARADAFGVKGEKLSNRALRKAVVLAARKDAKTNGSSAYYAAAFDMLPKGSKPTDRADAWSRLDNGKRPTVDDGDRADADPSATWRDNIDAAFAARHGDAR